MDDKKLDLILSKVEKIDKLEADMQDMKADMQGMKADMQDMKADIQKLDAKVEKLDARVEKLEGSVAGIRLHLENCTDNNIQLLAENFIELTNKLNQAIPVADKNYAYEVKVNYLIREVQEIKEKIAMQESINSIIAS